VAKFKPFYQVDGARRSLYGRVVSISNVLFHLRVFLGILVLLPVVGCSGGAQRANELGQLAASQLENGDIQAARKSITEAIQKRDDIVELQLLRGRIELKANSFASAFSAYSDALALDPSNVEALEGVAQLGLRTSNLRESEAAVDQLLTMNPGHANALTLKGVHLLVRKRSSEAVATADRILAIDPLNESGTILKARALYGQGQLEEGLRVLLALDSKVKPRSQAMAASLLEFYRESNDARGMLEQFGLLERFRPNDIEIRIDEANARYKLGNLKEARSLLQWAMSRSDLSSKQAETITELWSEYDTSVFPQPSLELLRTKGNPDARLVFARYLLDANNHAAALNILTGLDGDSAKALRARASVASGDVTSGLSVADTILQRDKSNCDALLAKAEALLSAKAFPGAVEAGQLASATCPKMMGPHLVLVEAYSGLADSTAVRRVFADAIADLPQSSPLSRRFARWLEAKGEPVRAIAVARRLTNKAPALVSGWTLLHELCVRSKDQECAADARKGLAEARGRLAIDPSPGEGLARGLFGRLRNQHK
jgi:tetratricopeptide (TPR) repeat protein